MHSSIENAERHHISESCFTWHVHTGKGLIKGGTKKQRIIIQLLPLSCGAAVSCIKDWYSTMLFINT